MTSHLLRSVGVAVIEALRTEGVDVVFGIPGTHNIELYRGIDACGVRHVSPRHEQGAAYAADGYARSSGRPGVVITTSGPGLTNAATGIANAYADSVPMLVISPGIPTGLEREDIGWLHEVKDQRSALENLADRSIRPATAEQAVAAIHQIFARWRVERPRPVHLELPVDLLESMTDTPVGDRLPLSWPAGVAGSALAAVAEAAATSIRPLLIAGGGSVGAAEQLTGLAELLDAPVLTTTLGKGVIDENHPLALGEFAAYSSATGIVGDADLVIAVGTELANPAVFAGFTGTLVRVDLDGSQVQKNVPAGIPIVSDAAEFARAALAVLDRRPAAREPGAERAALARERLARALPASVTRWRGLQRALEAGLPDDVIVTGDSSRVSYLGTGPHWRFARPRHYLVTTGYSTLGYALPAAIGAALANPDAPVLALMGDGAFLFSAQELLTAADDELPLAVVVVDSHGYQEIEDNMRDAALEPFAVSLLQPDYASLAAAMRADFAQPTTIAGLLECVLDALDGTRPTLIVFESTDHNLAG